MNTFLLTLFPSNYISFGLIPLPPQAFSLIDKPMLNLHKNQVTQFGRQTCQTQTRTLQISFHKVVFSFSSKVPAFGMYQGAVFIFNIFKIRISTTATAISPPKIKKEELLQISHHEPSPSSTLSTLA